MAAWNEDAQRPRPPAEPNDFSQMGVGESTDPFAMQPAKTAWTQQPGLVDAQGRRIGDPGFDVTTAQWSLPSNPGNDPGPWRSGYVMPDQGGMSTPGGIGGLGTGTAQATTATSATALQKLLQTVAGVGGLTAGHLLAGNAQNSAVPPQLSQLLDMGVQRAQYQNPLFQAMTSGAYQMLPDFAKTGQKAPGT